MVIVLYDRMPKRLNLYICFYHTAISAVHLYIDKISNIINNTMDGVNVLRDIFERVVCNSFLLFSKSRYSP